VEPNLEAPYRQGRRWKTLAAVAVAGTVMIGSVAALIYSSRSTSAKRVQSSTLLPRVSEPPRATPLTVSPGPSDLSYPAAGALTNPTTTPPPADTANAKGGTQPMGASVSILSTVTNGAGKVRISGTASPGAKVTVNGSPVNVSGGTWSVNLNVGPAATTVNVVAVSADGSSRSSSSVTVSG
jgi:hypothetical protein